MKKLLLIALIFTCLFANAQVFLGMGASSSKMEFDYLQQKFPTIPNRNENLILINGNKPSVSLEDMSNDPDRYFDVYVGAILKENNITPDMVDYIWLKTASLRQDIANVPRDDFIQYEVELWNNVLNEVNARFPNATIYLSGRHEGYGMAKHAAPHAEYNYYSVQQICDNGRAIFAHPFFLQTWGENYTLDGVHPNQMALDSAVNYMIRWYSANTDWFLDKPVVIEPDPEPLPSPSNKDFTGFNGEHWFTVFNPSSADSMLLLNVIPPGEGFTLRFRADKDSFLIDNTKKLIETDKLLKRNNRQLYVIYTTDVEITLPQIVVDRINELTANRIAVIAVEADNEYYAKARSNFDFSVYKALFLPIRTALLNAYPTLPFLICIPSRPYDSNGNGFKESDDILGGRIDNKKWNDAAAEYLKTAPPFDGIVIHIYQNANELPSLPKAPSPFLYTPGNYPELTDYYNKILAEYNSTGKALWEKTLDYLNRVFPGRDVYVTEWGITGAEIRNTWATGYIYYDIWMNYADRFKVLLNHNGMARTVAGAWYPGRSIDNNKGALTTRVDAFVYEAFRNGGYVNAQYNYSSAGATAWMMERSVPGYEISKVDNNSSGNFSFGSDKNIEICFKDSTIIIGYDKVIAAVDSTQFSKPVSETVSLNHNGVSSTMIMNYEVTYFEYDTTWREVPITQIIQIPFTCK